MLFLGRKKKRKAKSFSTAELKKSFAEGFTPCQSCGRQLPLDRLEPLMMVECPRCKSINFVPLKIGNFWLYEPLGGGGMGSVYKAFHIEAPNDLYAVKVLARSEKKRPAQIQALLNEARIGEIIGDHPSLVKCVASGYVDNEYYAAMEYVEGERLDKLIDVNGHLEEKVALNVAKQILAAEQHIYECGYLYRDLKPENVIVAEKEKVVLLDYGLCVPRTVALNPKDEFISGSPYYLPPERLLGLGEDAYSEIYSLGMVLFYALTGQTYYDASEVEALAKRHVSKVRLSISSKLRGFRPEMVQLLSSMIKQECNERFQTFSEAMAAIEEVQKTTKA